MAAVHAARRLLQLLLVAALATSTLVTSAVGEALVLHQHGARRAHLHVLGYGDLLSGASRSPWFGHFPSRVPALQSSPQPVRILAVVTTGAVFVPTSDAPDAKGDAAVAVQCAPFVKAAHDAGASGLTPVLLPTPAGCNASAVILLRNHTLLI